LIELMIVIAIIAIIAAIAIPNLIESRKASNEASAIQTLRAIVTAESIFRDRDVDKDGKADYADGLAELRGLVPGSVTAADPNLPGGKPYSGYWFGALTAADGMDIGTEF